MQKINAAAEAIVSGLHEREAIAQRIFGLASMTGQVQPGDVSRTAVEEVANAASRLLSRGGEVTPELLHDPRNPGNSR